MSKGVRVIGPDRAQLRWEMVDLDQPVAGRPPGAAGLGVCGSPRSERVLRSDQGARRGCRAAGNGSAGCAGGVALCDAGGDRLGAGDRPAVPAARGLSLAGAPINHDLLATFRRENAALLDRLLTQSVTGLIAEKLIPLEELAIDGTKSLPSRRRGCGPARAGAR
jgi:hypothetical protein